MGGVLKDFDKIYTIFKNDYDLEYIMLSYLVAMCFSRLVFEIYGEVSQVTLLFSVICLT